MVAIHKLFRLMPEPAATRDDRSGSLTKLKQLHAEAEETARLANLLGRSVYVGVALPVMAVLTLGLSVDMNPAAQLVWCGFVGAIALAVLIAYRQAIRRPFERATLKEYAKDFAAILLFAGFAWGSGAFLALAPATTALPAILFMAVPSLVVAYLLRDREALFLFLAPVSGLTTAACVLKPYEGGYWLAGLVLVASAAVAGAAIVHQRVRGVPSKPAMLLLP